MLRNIYPFPEWQILFCLLFLHHLPLLPRSRAAWPPLQLGHYLITLVIGKDYEKQRFIQAAKKIITYPKLFFFFTSILFVCVCVDMCVCVRAHACVHVYMDGHMPHCAGGQETTSDASPLLPPWDWVSCLLLSISWPTSFQGFDWLHLPSLLRSAGMTDPWATAPGVTWVLMLWTQAPHICAARALPTKSSLQHSSLNLEQRQKKKKATNLLFHRWRQGLKIVEQQDGRNTGPWVTAWNRAASPTPEQPDSRPLNVCGGRRGLSTVSI